MSTAMKKAILTMVFSSIISRALQFETAGPSDLHERQTLLDTKVEQIFSHIENRARHNSLADDNSLEHIFPIGLNHAIGPVSHRMVKRSGSPPKRPSDVDRQQHATKIVTLGLSDRSRPSKVPPAPPSNLQKSPEKDQNAPGVSRSSISSKVQDARRAQTLELLDTSGPSRIPLVPMSAKQQSPHGDQTASKASGSPFSSSKIATLSRIQQSSNLSQDRDGKMVPEGSEFLQRSKSSDILKEQSRDPPVGWNTGIPPASVRAVTRSTISALSALLEHARNAKDGASSSRTSPRSRLDIKEPKQSADPPKTDPKLPSQPLQASSSMDVTGIPSGLAKIKVTGDKTGGLYERLERGASFAGPYSGAYFRHISMIGSPRAPLSRPPGLPKPLRVPRPPTKT